MRYKILMIIAYQSRHGKNVHGELQHTKLKTLTTYPLTIFSFISLILLCLKINQRFFFRV